MKCEEQVNMRKERAHKGDRMKFWPKLRVQMTISYVGVSVVSALLVELLLALLFFLIILRLPYVDQNAMNAANHVAQVYALEAAVQAGGNALDPRTTFQSVSLYHSRCQRNSTLDPKTIALSLLIAPMVRYLPVLTQSSILSRHLSCICSLRRHRSFAMPWLGNQETW